MVDGVLYTTAGSRRAVAAIDARTGETLVEAPFSDRDPESGKPLDDAKVRSAIKDGERRLDGHGRLVIRLSGTEPVIRVMGEGDDKGLVEEVVDGIVEALNRVAA